MARPTITRITVEIDGTRTLEFDPEDTSALFFQHDGPNAFDAVVGILVPHYNVVRNEPANGTALANEWDLADSTGQKPALAGKRPNCTYAVIR